MQLLSSRDHCLSVRIKTSGIISTNETFKVSYRYKEIGKQLEDQLAKALRTLMLYSSFCDICIEAEKNKNLTVSERDMQVTSMLSIGNLCTLEISLGFFADDDGVAPSRDAKFFKNVFLSIVESTYTPNLMRNLSFIYATKLVT